MKINDDNKGVAVTRQIKVCWCAVMLEENVEGTP